jgi:hypothetical protein
MFTLFHSNSWTFCATAVDVGRVLAIRTRSLARSVDIEAKILAEDAVDTSG